VEGSAAPVELDMAEAWRLDGCVEDGSDYHVKLFRKRYHPVGPRCTCLYGAENLCRGLHDL
jgi:hypothetical protein